jgi:hypothetical protein
MPNSYDAVNMTEATLKRTCLSQVIVGLSSALASTAVLLVQVLPPLMHGFP